MWTRAGAPAGRGSTPCCTVYAQHTDDRMVTVNSARPRIDRRGEGGNGAAQPPVCEKFPKEGLFSVGMLIDVCYGDKIAAVGKKALAIFQCLWYSILAIKGGPLSRAGSDTGPPA